MEKFKDETVVEKKKGSGCGKYAAIFILLGLIIGGSYLWWQYYYVFGEGVKSGQLNYVVKKGNVFKTYEGKLIQVGLKSNAPGSMASNEFEFSISDPAIADSLMNNSGKFFDLHYKEYKGAIPWRGYSKYVVDEIIKVHQSEP